MTYTIVSIHWEKFYEHLDQLSCTHKRHITPRPHMQAVSVFCEQNDGVILLL